MNASDLSIIIQGRCEEECLHKQETNYSKYALVYSLWNEEKLNVSQRETIRVVKAPTPTTRGKQNYFLQVISTLNGLKLVQTKYCIKMRADEYVSNIEYILKCVVEQPDLLHTLPVFFRPYNSYKFHISDHLIAGTTENLKLMFEACHNKIVSKNWNENVFVNEPEIELTKTYLEQKEMSSIEDNRYLMKKYFNILDIDKVKPYIIVANGMRKKFYDDFDPKKNNSITTLDDY